MNSSDRIAFFESLLDMFVSSAKEKGYITFAQTGDADEYVQYQLHGGRLFGEVGSRQWTDPERPLPDRAVAALAVLGFTGGGPERNYSKDGLPTAPSTLAALTDTLFRTAYDVDDEYAPMVHHLNLNDVPMARAEPFTRDMIAVHLRARDVRALRDDDGDFRVDLQCEGSDVPVTLWLIAEGDGDTMYRIVAYGDHRPTPATRVAAVDRCNRWNREHRWPTACVVDQGDSWRILVGSNIELKPGITHDLFASFTDCVVTGALEFWEWMAHSEKEPAQVTSEESA